MEHFFSGTPVAPHDQQSLCVRPLDCRDPLATPGAGDGVGPASAAVRAGDGVGPAAAVGAGEGNVGPAAAIAAAGENEGNAGEVEEEAEDDGGGAAALFTSARWAE